MKRLTFALVAGAASILFVTGVDKPKYNALAQSMGSFGAFGNAANQEQTSAEVEKVVTARLKLADANSDEERRLAERDLQQALTDYFAVDMRRRRQDLDDIKRRLATMQSHLDKRVAAKDEILGLQLKSYAYEAEGLGLFDADAQARVNAAFAENSRRKNDFYSAFMDTEDAAQMMGVEIEVEDDDVSTGFEALGGGPSTLGKQAAARHHITEMRRKLKDADTDDQRARLMNDLKLAMERYFDAVARNRTRELKDIEERVAELEQHLAKRGAAKDEIINLQIRMFVREADGLGFFLKTSRSSPNTRHGKSVARDASIAKEIISRFRSLKADGQLRDFGVDVAVEDGTVTLTGYVATEEQLSVLSSEVLEVQSVRKLLNEVAVRRTTHKPRSG